MSSPKANAHDLFLREPAIKNPVFIDGITRAGKFFLAKVVSHFESIEYYQYIPLLEHIPIMWKYGQISKANAVAYLRLYSDLHIYDFLMGRNLNMRGTDSSSILNAADKDSYLARVNDAEGIEALKSLQNQKRVPSFLVHEMMPLSDIYFEAFESAKMINIQRHPVDIIHSWHARAWGERFFKPDIASFVPTLQTETGTMPWFAVDWFNAQTKYKPIDLVVQSVLNVNRLENKHYHETLAPLYKDRIHLMCYEHLVESPDDEIQRLSSFLETSPQSVMGEILKREGCYRQLSVDERDAKYKSIKQEASEESVQLLDEAIGNYEKKWERTLRHEYHPVPDIA